MASLMERALATASEDEKRETLRALAAEFPDEIEPEGAEEEEPTGAAEDEEPEAAEEEEPEEEPEAEEEEEPAATFEQLDRAVSAKVPDRDALIARGLRDKVGVSAFQVRVQEHLLATAGKGGGKKDAATAELERHARGAKKPAPASGAAARTGGYETYDEAVEAVAAEKKISKNEARAIVNREFPALREEYVAKTRGR